MIGQALSEQGFAVTVLPPAQAVDGYDAVMIGSAVYTGHWLDPAKDLVSRCREALADRPVRLFSSGQVGKPSGKLAQARALTLPTSPQCMRPPVRAITGCSPANSTGPF